MSVKPPQNLQSSDRTRAGAGLGLVWGFVEMFVLLRRHRWTWRWFYCGIIVIWGCAFSPQRVWHECKNQGFLRLGYFIFCLILISALARPAMEGVPSWEKPQPPFCHCYFCCLFLLAKRLKPTAGGAEEQRWELQAGKNLLGSIHDQNLVLSLGNSVPAPAEGETLQAKIYFRALSLVVGCFFSTCFGEVIKCLR